MKALNDAFTAEVNVLNEAFKIDSKKATTPEERLALMRAFQEEITALRNRTEEKTQEIQSRYR